MKTPAVLALLCLAGCSSLPGLDQPRVTLVPQVILLEVSGDTKMESDPGGGIVQNPSMHLDRFGVGDRDTNFGGMLRLGDGFSGFDLSYLHLDVRTTDTGVLSQDWGNLRQGDVVNTEIDGNEYRARYIAELISPSFEMAGGEELTLQLGAGATLAHHELKFRVQQVGGPRTQTLRIKDDGVVYLAARGRLAYRWFGVMVDYGISPDITFGGDFDGVLQDLEIMGTFSFEDQDLTAFAGWRYSELPASGHEGELDYDIDLTLDGFVLGLELTF